MDQARPIGRGKISAGNATIFIFIVILVIAGVAGAYYVPKLMPGLKGTSSISEVKSPPSFPDNIGELIANFSQMKIALNLTSSVTPANGSGSISQNSISSYIVTDSLQNGSGKLTIVNFTNIGLVSSSPSSAQYLVYFNQTWSPTLVTFQEHNYTGSNANSFALAAEHEFLFLLDFEKQFFENSSNFVGLTMQGTSNIKTFGTVQLRTTTWVESGLSPSSYFEAQLGSPEGQSWSILTHMKASGNYSVSGVQGTQSYQYQLLSAMLTSSSS